MKAEIILGVTSLIISLATLFCIIKGIYNWKVEQSFNISKNFQEVLDKIFIEIEKVEKTMDKQRRIQTEERLNKLRCEGTEKLIKETIEEFEKISDDEYIRKRLYFYTQLLNELEIVAYMVNKKHIDNNVSKKIFDKYPMFDKCVGIFKDRNYRNLIKERREENENAYIELEKLYKKWTK